LLTRLGFAARGLLYITISLLVIGTGRAEDPQGALNYLAQGGGKILLIVMALGLAAYALWRLADAAMDLEGHGGKGKGLRERAGAAGSGLVHLFLAWQAVRLLHGASSASSGGGTQEGAQSALQLPGGQVLLGVAALILLGVGAFQLIKAAKAYFLRKLEPSVATDNRVKWAGRLGYAARGIVFLITGYFLGRAALHEQAAEAGGMAEALRWMNGPAAIAVAIGLLMFGMFSFIEARYRRIHSVPVDEAAGKLRGQAGI